MGDLLSFIRTNPREEGIVPATIKDANVIDVKPI
jgi:hypothetical protein